MAHLNLRAHRLRHLRFALLIAAAIASILCIQNSTYGQRRKRPIRSFPRVSAVDTAGLERLLKRDNGKPLLVNYWATWCDPCRDEFPDLVKIDSLYRPKGLDFIAITLDDLQDIKTAVPKFLRQMNAHMPVYLLSLSDPEPAIKMIDPNWGGALPATFLYNGKGEVVYKSLGRVKVDELRTAINKVIGTE
ncbi:MAG TPA: TlpA disulfide reductase family protein [Pyrinomonadaceae bacterium]|nr:TlpA disulfide reductase family protein [Pyrinomonadaceae bacterium]